MLSCYTNQLLSAFAALLLIGNAGCANIYGPEGLVQERRDYQNEQAAEPIRVPKSLTSAPINADIAVPAPVRTQENLEQTVDIVPPDSLVAANAQQRPVHRLVLPARSMQTTLNAQGLWLANQALPQAYRFVGSALVIADYPTIHQNDKIYVYFVLDPSKTAWEINKDTPIYQVHLSAHGDNVLIELTDNEGKALEPKLTKHVLTTLDDALHGKDNRSLLKRLASELRSR